MTRTVKPGVSTAWAALLLALPCAVCLLIGTTRAHAQALAAQGNWHSGLTDGKEGTWQLQAGRSDADFQGTLTATGPCDFPQGNVFGTLSATGDIHFGVMFNDTEEGTFTGTLSGGVVSGTYSTTGGDSGTWAGSLTSATQK